jgi:FAD/FMN-containing dehydrogenase
MMQHNLPALFQGILSPGQILTAAADLEFYGKDVCKQFSAHPSLVLTPSTPQQVADILKICSLHKIAVVPSGGRTG